MRTPDHRFSIFSALIALLVGLVGTGILAAPSRGQGNQDAGQATAPAAAPSTPKPVDLPEGEGKAIAVENCQACHKLTNLTKAHKSLDDWKDTVETMIERGANVPADKIDTLVKYLAQNFGPQSATAPASGAAAPPAPASSANAAPAAAAKPVELPEGDGKAIATENCQACHKLTNVTRARKSLDEWKDTVQTMIDRGANVPADKLDILLQYLVKNFGPKDASTPTSAAPGSSAQSQ